MTIPRLSLLFGNYVTLTNMSEREVDRIIAMHYQSDQYFGSYHKSRFALQNDGQPFCWKIT